MPRMVDVSEKAETRRVAVAEANVVLPRDAAQALTMVSSPSATSSSFPEIYAAKGPVIATAVIAWTMATKKTSDLVPFCHPISLEDCNFDISFRDQSADDDSSPVRLVIRCECVTTGKTGVEMEAMTGASVAALTVYDMLKARTHEIEISNVRLLQKDGGKRGKWQAKT